jgi:hypothetical protein
MIRDLIKPFFLCAAGFTAAVFIAAGAVSQEPALAPALAPEALSF